MRDHSMFSIGAAVPDYRPCVVQYHMKWVTLLEQYRPNEIMNPQLRQASLNPSKRPLYSTVNSNARPSEEVARRRLNSSWDRRYLVYFTNQKREYLDKPRAIRIIEDVAGNYGCYD